MQPLNPYLRAFFRSALPAQCQPVAHHLLLVPSTDVLLNSKDRDLNAAYADVAGTEEFLASHVLRVPNGGLPTGNGASKDGSNMRENKSKAKQYTTMNGRTVIIKDSFVYSNRGFKTLNQAQLLFDTIYYPDVADGQQWLVYYISKPLVGIYQATPILPAVISDEPSKERKEILAEATGLASSSQENGASPPKRKDIKNFGDVLNNFPMISRHMQNGLEKVIRDFVAANDKPIPKRHSRSSSISSQRSVQSIRSSVSSITTSLSGSTTIHPTSLELRPEEQSLRSSFERAVNTAIDLFQSVDKQQLSHLGANTELTGQAVERLIERYIAEQVHDQTVFPRICAFQRPEDSDLESKVRRMADIDIAQVGVPIEGGMKGKRMLARQLAKGVEAFRKMGVASSPQEMLQTLLNTQKVVTAIDPLNDPNGRNDDSSSGEKQTPLTINADILVSMLLIVVIRSGVRHLHSRLLCMRYFIFTDEVESGEHGYALATLEAVLAHLSGSSHALRKISKRNRLLWQAVKEGDLQALEVILQPQLVDEATLAASPVALKEDSSDEADTSADVSFEEVHDNQQPPNGSVTTDFAAINGSLHHVFPFQRPPTPPPEDIAVKSRKRVSMVSLPRSQSASSAYSSRSHSRHKSVDSDTSVGVAGDMTADKLAQTQDAEGSSLLMMAVETQQRQALRFLLSIPAHFRAAFVLDDVNNEGTSLLSAAVQTGNSAITEELIGFLEATVSDHEISRYLELQDSKGRCFAHYLFHQPHLIQRFGQKLPWRLKDKIGQTPLFALCRSYDHEQYHSMVDQALALATHAQGDRQALHLDDHVDFKGNTLLHIVNDVPVALKLMRHCDSDVNAANDKRFTPLMVGSKYGRIDLVRALFGDPRVDMALKDIRGLTAVELAKDDDVRNRIDDLVLLSSPPGKEGRITTVVRSFFVEDATVRMVLKSGAPNPNGMITITTCRRSVADFENLARWLAIECPASWIPTHFNLPSPYLIPSRPSRAILRDTQIRLDNFFRNLMNHGTFATHELVWEFFLVPEIDVEMLTERSKRKAEARVENVKDDYEPITDTQEVENFVAFARDQMKGVSQAARKTMRVTNKYRMLQNDFHEAQSLATSAIQTLLFLPPSYVTAVDRYTKLLATTESAPLAAFYYALHSIHSSSTAIQIATDRPAYLIGSMSQAQRSIERSMGSISRSNRWTPNISIFEDTKKAVAREAWEKAAKARREMESLGCELRYTQQTIAGELAAWQEEHVRSGKLMLRRLAREMVVKERARLEGMKRALREIKKARV